VGGACGGMQWRHRHQQIAVAAASGGSDLALSLAVRYGFMLGIGSCLTSSACLFLATRERWRLRAWAWHHLRSRRSATPAAQNRASAAALRRWATRTAKRNTI